jgi:hypothetical protein
VGTNPGSIARPSPLSRAWRSCFPHRGIGSATSNRSISGLILPFTCVPAYTLPVYASQGVSPHHHARLGTRRLARLYRGSHLRLLNSMRFPRRNPAQTRTCSIPASGSSVALASAQAKTVTGPPPVCCSPRVGLAHSSPARHVRDEFPLRATCFRQVLPPVVGFPHLRVLFLIRLPIGIRRAFPFTVLLRLPAPTFPPST